MDKPTALRSLILIFSLAALFLLPVPCGGGGGFPLSRSRGSDAPLLLPAAGPGCCDDISEDSEDRKDIDMSTFYGKHSIRLVP